MTSRSNRALRGAGIVAAALAAAFPVSGAHAFQVGIQDQGVPASALAAVYGDLGASSVRVIARPGDDPALVHRYRDLGMPVQAAVLLKRDTTPGDVRGLIRSWDGAAQTVSIGNEPELNGLAPCQYASVYRRIYRMIRREFPRITIGYGEASPSNPIDYLRAVLRCPGPRLRAAFYAIHAYQWWTDPLSAPVQERAAGGANWIGLGNLRVLRGVLRERGVRRRLSTPAGRALPIRVTEFSYLTSGRYATTPEKAAWLWPRAVKQARRWAEQLVIYGTGPVAPGNWGDASLIDGAGRATPAYRALARALGRVIREDDEPKVPIRGELPGLPNVAPLAHGEGKTTEAPNDAPADEEKPVVIEDPVLEPLPEPEPTAETPPVEPVEAP